MVTYSAGLTFRVIVRRVTKFVPKIRLEMKFFADKTSN
ncbi:hypothetical protein GNIT_1097 [Glaciecola nitratireducens FR1064]|uniref:Uncharacterized protein n=1 Tax=Glaciecola nitratireducens (strain JCM 12485 / KCTC 12276 / FR1064) TaxID=1085623 RepID=G4QG62_GLANF|nr:hypothetical protein GNIT_1097 [Glaciecola nitratireducens FR1064]